MTGLTPYPAPWRAGLATALALGAVALSLAGCGGGEEATTSTAAQDPPQERPGGSPRPAPEPRTGDGRGGVRLEEIGTFEQPLYVTQPQAGDDAIYVVEQTGRVQRVPADGGDPEVFLDVSDEISCCGEQGLLSIAFAPDYESSGVLYASYTDEGGESRVIEYRRSDSGDVGDPSSAREVLAVHQPYANHNGGLVVFGPDDNLYLGFGDGGAAADPERNGQDLSTVLAKILRITPTPNGDEPYEIPADNPFADREGARPEIFALGLRNPWRFSFDRRSGDLWIGDVGQNELEEVDGLARSDAAGANLGWSAYEGNEPFNSDQEAPDHVPPVHVYGRDEGCSVTGGYVARDPGLESLYGRYLYGDYCEGELRSFTARPSAEAADDTALGIQIPGLSSFGEDADGHLYATSIEGPVYRLEPAGG